ncbi:MAG: cache domain-containing protein [Thermoguttaceae bacterium]|nr:cache domain-containing protein [Thermoguttaceae bacterium]
MSIRFKLTMAAIAVILIANSLVCFVGVQYAGHVWLKELQNRVRLDLSSVRAAYDGSLQQTGRFLNGVALDVHLAQAVAADDAQGFGPLLDKALAQGTIDFITLLDARGRVLFRPHNPARRGDNLARNPLVSQAIRRRGTSLGTLSLNREQLRAEGDDLARRAEIELRPTQAARETTETLRSEGLVAAAAVPLLDSQGQLAGVLYAGSLLNGRFDLVDRIRAQVFPSDLFDDEQAGRVTIFHGDLRVATNVVAADGRRAVGTRMSREVYDRVIVRGQAWADRAFVVDDWYIAAYEPIREPGGKVVGALYVGLRQAPFVHKRNVVMAVFLGLVIAATLATLFLLYVVSVLVLRPVDHIVAMARRVIAGDASARVGVRPPGEMGVLCRAIDQMADALAEREERLKVATRQQIGRSEKLASIGRLAAGVAHEINNPLTGVLTFAHLLREKSNLDDQDRQDLDLIIHETTRAADIVKGLLDFARERPARKEPLAINEVVARTVRLIRNQKAFDRIRIIDQLVEDLPEVNGDMNQLQQVLLNLSLNACEAMPDGGVLTIATSSRDDKVFVRLTDTGCGIKAEHLDKIFEPFYTTKPVGQGTGLGLSVSYGIIEQHGGTMEVESREGEGTTFSLALPAIVPRDGEPGPSLASSRYCNS